MAMLLVLLVTVAALVSLGASKAPDLYNERLDLQPLTDKFVLASFHFETIANSGGAESVFASRHQSLFPRVLAQILTQTNTQELHLRFSRGRWDLKRWGRLPANGSYAGGTGAEIWAYVDETPEYPAFDSWRTLVNSLSGLSCASLNFIDETITQSPRLAFKPDGPTDAHVFHAMLPQESVCTENLTPFLKLMPCKGRAGLSSLLNGHRLFNSQWHSMSLDVVPMNEHGQTVRLVQRVDIVLDIDRCTSSQDGRQIPTPPHDPLCNCEDMPDGSNCLLLEPSNRVARISDLFGATVHSRCSIAQQSLVTVFAKEGKKMYDFNDASFDLQFECSPGSNAPISLLIDRSMTGHGGEHGGIALDIQNPSSLSDYEVVYYEALPWFMRPYFHTIRLTANGADVNEQDNIVKEMFTLPFIDRVRGTHLEMRLRIPRETHIQLRWDFDKGLLRYTEYPPDANRGFDIPGAIFVITEEGSQNLVEVYRSSSLLLALPTPDFSMPYNVIIFTSTVIALAFGSIFNFLIRRFELVEALDKKGPNRSPRILASALRSLRSLKSRFGRESST